MRSLAFALLSLLGLSVHATTNFSCTDSRSGYSVLLSIAPAGNEETHGNITLTIPSGPLKGELKGACFTPNPPHAWTQVWPLLTCSMQAPNNSGASLWVYGDLSHIEKVEGSSWVDGRILPGPGIHLTDCQEVQACEPDLHR